jgi:hypothetical protein
VLVENVGNDVAYGSSGNRCGDFVKHASLLETAHGPAALGKRVVFLSDITRWLADIGLSWERMGVNFATAQDELEHQARGLFVMVSRRAYSILRSTARA